MNVRVNGDTFALSVLRHAPVALSRYKSGQEDEWMSCQRAPVSCNRNSRVARSLILVRFLSLTEPRPLDGKSVWLSGIKGSQNPSHMKAKSFRDVQMWQMWWPGRIQEAFHLIPLFIEKNPITYVFGGFIFLAYDAGVWELCALGLRAGCVETAWPSLMLLWSLYHPVWPCYPPLSPCF